MIPGILHSSHTIVVPEHDRGDYPGRESSPSTLPSTFREISRLPDHHSGNRRHPAALHHPARARKELGREFGERPIGGFSRTFERLMGATRPGPAQRRGRCLPWSQSRGWVHDLSWGASGFARDSPLEGNGFELSVPVRQAKLTRSCR
jgi:hypothetical protein